MICFVIVEHAPSWLCFLLRSGSAECSVRADHFQFLTLICSDHAFKLLGGAHLFSQLAQSADSFVCELSSHFLIELLKKKDPEQYLARLAKLVGRAQLDDDHEMLTNRFARSLF